MGAWTLEDELNDLIDQLESPLDDDDYERVLSRIGRIVHIKTEFDSGMQRDRELQFKEAESAGRNANSNRELELKERELALKERELDIREVESAEKKESTDAELEIRGLELKGTLARIRVEEDKAAKEFLANVIGVAGGIASVGLVLVFEVFGDGIITSKAFQKIRFPSGK